MLQFPKINAIVKHLYNAPPFLQEIHMAHPANQPDCPEHYIAPDGFNQEFIGYLNQI